MKWVGSEPWSTSKGYISNAFRCSNVLAFMGLKSFCLWCLKLGGTPKQLPSILERCIIGWQLCATYASLSLAWMHRTSCTTILGVKPSTIRNVKNSRDGKKQRSQSPGDKRKYPNYPAQRSPKDHKNGIPLNTFCLVQPENISRFTSWIFLDPPSFISWVSSHSVR